MKWIIRPATTEDSAKIDALLYASYSKLFPMDYSADILDKALPIISKAKPDLLTCGTWYVVEDFSTRELVGCGGWTPE